MTLKVIKLTVKAFPESCQHFLIVYYIIVVAFENNVQMCLGEHSLTFCQDYLSVGISQLFRSS